MVAKVQLRVWAPAPPVTEQPEKAGTGCQLRSAPGGSESLTVTLLAVPSPLLTTVTSNPMVAPALTGPTGLATLLMVTLGHWRTTDTCPGAGVVGLLPSATVAVLAMV